MACLKEYMCNCGNDGECVDAITEMFESLIVSEDSKAKLDQFREMCSHYDKFVTGFCTPSPKGKSSKRGQNAKGLK